MLQMANYSTLTIGMMVVSHHKIVVMEHLLREGVGPTMNPQISFPLMRCLQLLNRVLHTFQPYERLPGENLLCTCLCIHLLSLNSAASHSLLINVPHLIFTHSGALNVGSICETSDKALLLELHRSLQLFTSQQQFLIGQVVGVCYVYFVSSSNVDFDRCKTDS